MFDWVQKYASVSNQQLIRKVVIFQNSSKSLKNASEVHLQQIICSILLKLLKNTLTNVTEGENLTGVVLLIDAGLPRYSLLADTKFEKISSITVETAKQ